MFKRLRDWLDGDSDAPCTVFHPSGQPVDGTEGKPRRDAIRTAEQRFGTSWGWLLNHGFDCRADQ